MDKLDLIVSIVNWNSGVNIISCLRSVFQTIKNPVKAEFRTLFKKDILPNSEEVLEIMINPPGDLLGGEYLLKFDIVNEHRFWLEDVGSEPLILKKVILKNR